MSIAPWVDCPMCGEMFEVSDMHEIDEGSLIECPHCDTELIVASVDITVHWQVQEYIVQLPANHDLALGGREDEIG